MADSQWWSGGQSVLRGVLPLHPTMCCHLTPCCECIQVLQQIKRHMCIVICLCSMPNCGSQSDK